MDAIVSRALPFTVRVQHTKQAHLATLDQAGMHGVGILRGIRANVHHNTRQASANATLLNSLGNTIKAIAVRQHGFEKGCGTRFEHLGNA